MTGAAYLGPGFVCFQYLVSIGQLLIQFPFNDHQSHESVSLIDMLQSGVCVSVRVCVWWDGGIFRREHLFKHLPNKWLFTPVHQGFRKVPASRRY